MTPTATAFGATPFLAYHQPLTHMMATMAPATDLWTGSPRSAGSLDQA